MKFFWIQLAEWICWIMPLSLPRFLFPGRAQSDVSFPTQPWLCSCSMVGQYCIREWALLWWKTFQHGCKKMEVTRVRMLLQVVIQRSYLDSDMSDLRPVLSIYIELPVRLSNMKLVSVQRVPFSPDDRKTPGGVTRGWIMSWIHQRQLLDGEAWECMAFL